MANFLSEIPDTIAAWKAGKKWVGVMAREQVQMRLATITENNKAETKGKIQECLKEIEAMTEQFCPTAVLMTPEGVMCNTKIKGFPSDETLIFIIADTQVGVLSLKGPLEFEEVPDSASPNNIWNAIIHFLTQDGAHALPTLIAWRLGKDGVAEVNKMTKAVQARGLTPIIIVVAVQKEETKTAAGMISVLSLPTSLSTQMLITAAMSKDVSPESGTA